MTSLRELDAVVSLRQGALRSIRAGIVTGEIQANEIYSAPAIAARLGVSVTPVREAMLDLVGQGLVEAVRNRGFRIVPISDVDLDEIHELRMLIEVPTCGRVAGRLPKSLARRLARLAADTETAAKRGDLVGFLSADRDFHLGLLELHGNRRLVDFIAQLRDQARLFGLGALVEAGELTVSAAEHRKILEAIERGDAAAAEAAMRKHLRHTRGAWAGMAEEVAGS
jgi:DNA-binding GntR family transcriptional regulator